MKATFQSQGKQWDDTIKARAKVAVAKVIASNPRGALISQKSTALQALARELVSKLRRRRGEL